MPASRSALWSEIYDLWTSSGISRAAFYEEKLQTFWPSELPFPALGTFYCRLRRVEIARTEQPSSVTSSSVTSTSLGGTDVPISQVEKHFQIAHVSAEALRRISAKSSTRQIPRAEQANGGLFRMQLPGGTLVEFTAASPQLLALQLFALSRRSA